MKLFKEDVAKDGEMVQRFCDALAEGDPKKVEELFIAYMKRTVSVRDTFVRKPVKENFYHGILLGILSFKEDWIVRSNKEAGDGFGDIIIWNEDQNTGIIIEIKYAEAENMEKVCQAALRQIDDKHYDEVFQDEEVHRIIKYGIACSRKKCRVIMDEVKK